MNDLVVVTGLFRSGSSMMMQILEAGGLKPVYHYLVPDENNENGYYEIDETRSERVFYEMSSGLYKRPCIKVLIPFLEKNKIIHLADKVIFIHRDIDEVIESTNKKTGYRPYKRKLLSMERDAKDFLIGQKIPVYNVNYNDIIKCPIDGLLQLRSIVDEVRIASNAVEERLYKTRHGIFQNS